MLKSPIKFLNVQISLFSSCAIQSCMNYSKTSFKYFKFNIQLCITFNIYTVANRSFLEEVLAFLGPVLEFEPFSSANK